MVWAALMAVAAGLYQPLGPESAELSIGADGRAWLVVRCPLQLPREGATVAWQMRGLGVDASSAVLSLQPARARAQVQWRRQVGELVQWRVVPEDGEGAVTVQAAALVRDLQIERLYSVELGPQAARWTCLVRFAGWKSKPLPALKASFPDGEATVSLQPDQSVTVPLWQRTGLALRWLLRWDSTAGQECAQRVLVLDRALSEDFGPLRLLPGKVVVCEGQQQWEKDFAGAQPGEKIELAAGALETLRVERVRAESSQQNVRIDVHRRLAAYDEQIRYEYAVVNAGAEEVTLEIVEHPDKGWQVKESSHPWQRQDASTLVLTVRAAPGSRVTVRVLVVRPNLTPA
jgi:hypothetical protein